MSQGQGNQGLQKVIDYKYAKEFLLPIVFVLGFITFRVLRAWLRQGDAKESKKDSSASYSPSDCDDKYAKAKAQNVLPKPMLTYICFVLAVIVGYLFLGGNFWAAHMDSKLSYASCVVEGFGLTSLRVKIQIQDSVTGISGMCMTMYALVYLLRVIVLMPSEDDGDVDVMDIWTIDLLQLASLVMVLDVVRSVFSTYRKTYQEELDVLHVKYLIPSCCVFAVLVHPLFDWGHFRSIRWTAYMYLDCLSLLPQVVMMARGGGKVESPVAHFVAATAMSRIIDLYFWGRDFDLGQQGYLYGFNFSGWLILIWHVISLLIVADFMYYYLKAPFSGKKLSDDLLLPVADDLC